MKNGDELMHSFKEGEYDPSRGYYIKGNYNGLTKREYFAILALQGIMATDTTSDFPKLAVNAVELADKLLKALGDE